MSICDYPSGGYAGVCNLEIIEALDSRSSTATGLTGSARGVGEAWELHFFLQGTNDECAVRERLEPGKPTGLPEVFPGFVPGAEPQGGALQAYPLQEVRVQNIGWQLWEINARYAWDGATNRDVFQLTLPTQISMSTRGGNTKLTESIRTIDSYPQLDANPGGAAESPAPDFERAIEWDGRRVNGVEVPTPLVRYSEVWIFDRARMFSPVTTGEQPDQSAPYGGDGNVVSTSWPNGRFQVWQDYTGCVHGPVHQKPRDIPDDNDKPPDEQLEDEYYQNEPPAQRQAFRGWDAGSVLLDNVNVRQIGLHHFEVAFDFLVQSNRKNQRLPWSVEDYMGYMREVDGWDHIWTYNESVSQPAQTTEATPQEYEVTAPRPSFIYVERIHERRNFLQLDIGNASLAYPNMLNLCTESVDLMNWWDRACNREIVRDPA